MDTPIHVWYGNPVLFREDTMNALKPGDRVKAYPVNLGTPDQTNFDPRVEGVVVGISNAGEQPTIMVEHGGVITSCEARTATVLMPEPRPKQDARPDLVAAVYGNGYAEARIRGSDAVVAGQSDIGKLARALVRRYPDGFHLDIRFYPHR
jgi:hypothetical protein